MSVKNSLGDLALRFEWLDRWSADSSFYLFVASKMIKDINVPFNDLSGDGLIHD